MILILLILLTSQAFADTRNILNYEGKVVGTVSFDRKLTDKEWQQVMSGYSKKSKEQLEVEAKERDKENRIKDLVSKKQAEIAIRELEREGMLSAKEVEKAKEIQIDNVQ